MFLIVIYINVRRERKRLVLPSTQGYSSMLRVNETPQYVEKDFYTSGMYNKRGEIEIPF